MDRRTFIKTAAGVFSAAGGLAAPAIGQRAQARVLRFVPQADLANFDPIWNTQYVVRNGAAHYVKMAAFLARYTAGLDRAQAAAVGGLWEAWNRPPNAQGDGVAQYNLALMHEQGQGVPQDNVVTVFHDVTEQRRTEADIVAALEHFGFSAICNVLAAIKTAKLLDLGPDDAIITVATDGAALYPSERAKLLATRYGNEFTVTDAAEVFGEHLGSVDTDNMIDCTEADRRRIFNLGYYTWVEQQGTPFDLFEARRHQDFWRGLRRYVDVWDDMIDDFNARVAG